MRKIYKYELPDVISYIFMPVGAKILSLQMQKNNPCIWAEVDTSNIEEQRIFIIFGTGQEINFKEKDISYINTVQQGVFVWHVYEFIGDASKM